MKSARNLKSNMVQGRVYRRQDLEQFSKAVDRDLSTLVENGEVRKVPGGGGLYYRPRKNAFGDAPPSEKELVRTFLKTKDFLVTSYNYFTQLGLGLTQVYNTYVVYNHKRFGEFSLGGKRFEFRTLPEYPSKLSKEFLLVDLLNNLKKVPDDSSVVLQNLKTRLNEYDQDKLQENLDRYGRASTKKLLAAYA